MSNHKGRIQLRDGIVYTDKHVVLVIYASESNQILELAGWARQWLLSEGTITPDEITATNEEIARLEYQLRDLGVII